MKRIGLEAGPLSQWLQAALMAGGHEVVLLETRHVKAALSAMTVKTDRKDARGIAQLLRMGWYPCGTREIGMLQGYPSDSGRPQASAGQASRHVSSDIRNWTLCDVWNWPPFVTLKWLQ